MNINLIATGGSDFHGSYNTKRKVGDFMATEESVEFIMNHMKKKA